MGKSFDILVIDDEQVVLDGIKRICTAEKYDIDTSADAPTALHKLDTNAYRLIVCDLMLPGMDGFRFLDEILKKGIEIPVIMTSGYSTLDNAVRSLVSGAIDFIPKPFTADELCSAVLRGLRYVDLRKETTKNISDAVIYVPCPPKYHKLGYMTWLYKDFRGTVTVGSTDLFLKTIGSIRDIKLKDNDEEIFQGSYCAEIVADQNIIHPVIAPMSGRILQTNRELEKDNTLLEKDPYFRGWLYKIVPADYQFEIRNLLTAGVNSPF